MSPTGASYLDFPAPALFQICWDIKDPRELSSMATFPNVKDRLKQFIHVYTTDASPPRIFQDFKDFHVRSLDDIPEEFTINLVEFTHAGDDTVDKAQSWDKLSKILNKCSELKQSKCLIGWNGDHCLDIVEEIPLNKLPGTSSVYIPNTSMTLRAGTPEVSGDLPVYLRDRLGGVKYTGWNSTDKIIAPFIETVTLVDLKETTNLTVDRLLPNVSPKEIITIGCDVRIPQYFNVDILERLDMTSLDWERFIGDTDGTNLKQLIPSFQLFAVMSMSFPTLKHLSLKGIKVLRDVDLPELETLEIHMIPALGPDSAVVVLPPRILNVHAPKVKTLELGINGPLMPSIKNLSVPSCDVFKFSFNTRGMDVKGFGIHNKNSELVVPGSAREVELYGTECEWVDEGSLKGKTVTRHSS